MTDVTEPVSVRLKSFWMVQTMVYPLPAGLAQLAVALTMSLWAKAGVANATSPTTSQSRGDTSLDRTAQMAGLPACPTSRRNPAQQDRLHAAHSFRFRHSRTPSRTDA